MGEATTEERPRPLFSSRYGYQHHDDPHPWPAGEHWRQRHDMANGRSDGCESDARLRCACPGGRRGPRRCCGRATAEDRLCAECHEWCYAVDDAGTYHRFITLYGEALS